MLEPLHRTAARAAGDRATESPSVGALHSLTARADPGYLQIALFHSIKPLFAGKQLVVVASKQVCARKRPVGRLAHSRGSAPQDVKKLSELSAADQAAVQSMLDADTLLMCAHAHNGAHAPAQARTRARGGSRPISNLTEEGIDAVKNVACDKLLEARVRPAHRATRQHNAQCTAVSVPRPVTQCTAAGRRDCPCARSRCANAHA